MLTRMLRTSLFGPFLLVAFFPTFAAWPAGAQAPADAPRDWWGVVELGGAAVGSASERVARAAGGEVETVVEVKLVLDRAGARIEIAGRATSRESADGRLLALAAENRFSAQTSTFEAIVEGDRLRLRTGSGGEGMPLREQLIDRPADLLGPEGVRRRTLAALRSPGDRVVFRQIVPELGAVFAFERTLLGVEEEVPGASGVRALKLEEKLPGTPLVRTLWLARDGDLLRQSEPGPFGETVLRRAARAEVDAAAAGGELPSGLFERSLIAANVRLRDPHRLERLRVRLSLAHPERGWPKDLVAENQRLVADEGASRLLDLVRVAEPSRAERPLALASEDLASYLAPNALIESDHPEIVRLAREITAGASDPYRRAVALTSWVAREMTFDLGIVMAPASELVRDRRGTCAGYATLLAALARAAGLPARYVMGYVYMLGVWGGHAWVEIRIGERWLPFDAAVFAPAVAGPARLAVARSSLAQGVGEANLALFQVFGNLSIEIVESALDEVTERAASGAKSYAIDGGRYVNPGLGVALILPEGWSIADADGRWPARALLSLAGPNGLTATLLEGSLYDRPSEAEAIGRLFEREAGAFELTRGAERGFGWSARGTNRAGLARLSGAQILALSVRGPGAEAALARLAQAIAWSANAAPVEAAAAR